MAYDSQKHHRQSIRLKGYDYSQAGAYFITVCVEDRACLFGDVAGGQMRLNDRGRMVVAEWNALQDRFSFIELDVFGVMPNHIHGIIVMEAAGTAVRPECESAAVARPRATTRVAPTTSPATSVPATVVPVPPVPVAPAPTPTVGDIVGAFKSLTTVLYIDGVKQSGWPGFRGRLWQRNFHEHIIRDEESLSRIRQYILDNPACWASDPENPSSKKSRAVGDRCRTWDQPPW